MGNYASSGLFFMSITGHKYRQFRTGRNMTRTQPGWVSCKQTNKKGSWKGLEVDSFLLHFFSRGVCFCLTDFYSSLSHAPMLIKYHFIAFYCILLSQHLSSKLIHSNSKFQPTFKGFLALLFQCVHLSEWSEPWSFFSMSTTLLHCIKGLADTGNSDICEIIGTVVILWYFTSTWSWDTGHRKVNNFSLALRKTGVLSFYPHRHMFNSFKKKDLHCAPHSKCLGSWFELNVLITFKTRNVS